MPIWEHNQGMYSKFKFTDDDEGVPNIILTQDINQCNSELTSTDAHQCQHRKLAVAKSSRESKSFKIDEYITVSDLGNAELKSSKSNNSKSSTKKSIKKNTKASKKRIGNKRFIKSKDYDIPNKYKLEVTDKAPAKSHSVHVQTNAEAANIEKRDKKNQYPPILEDTQKFHSNEKMIYVPHSVRYLPSDLIDI